MQDPADRLDPELLAVCRDVAGYLAGRSSSAAKADADFRWRSLVGAPAAPSPTRRSGPCLRSSPCGRRRRSRPGGPSSEGSARRCRAGGRCGPRHPSALGLGDGLIDHPHRRSRNSGGYFGEGGLLSGTAPTFPKVRSLHETQAIQPGCQVTSNAGFLRWRSTLG